MSWGLTTYNDASRREDLSDIIMGKELEISINKVENGYIVKLSGKRENLNAGDDADYYKRWVSFDARFVFNTIDDAMKDVEQFYKLIEDALNEKIESINK